MELIGSGMVAWYTIGNSLYVLMETNHCLWALYALLSVSLAVLTLRRLMSYIYIYIYMEHPFLMFLDHTQRRSTVGRTPLDE